MVFYLNKYYFLQSSEKWNQNWQQFLETWSFPTKVTFRNGSNSEKIKNKFLFGSFFFIKNPKEIQLFSNCSRNFFESIPDPGPKRIPSILNNLLSRLVTPLFHSWAYDINAEPFKVYKNFSIPSFAIKPDRRWWTCIGKKK